MELKEIKQLLQLYFNGESSDSDERTLEKYFQSGEVAAGLEEYAEFFGGISELAGKVDDSTIEEDVMDYILENENRDKTRYRTMWKTVTGIAASIIIILGSYLIYEQQQKPFKDTFDDPDKAYAYAQQTLKYVSSKYNKGLAELAYFEKLQDGSTELKKGLKPINEFYDGIEKAGSDQSQSQTR